MIYHVFTAEEKTGKCSTVLVSEDEMADSACEGPKDFFVPGATNIEDHGTVDIDGDAEHMFPGVLEG